MEPKIFDDKKLFTGVEHAESYHMFRPTYPSEVYETILSFLAAGRKLATPYGLAVDIACGTGQATPPLAPHFEKVIGCDVSKSQIDEANRHNKLNTIEYKVSAAEALPFALDGSVDLVTCALAFHWLDSDMVYPEMKRILRQDGVFAIYAYGLPELRTAEMQSLYDEFMKAVSSYLSPRIQLLINHYRDVNIPLKDVTRKDDITIEMDVPLSNFIGYLSSYSPYRALLKDQPQSEVLTNTSDRLKALLAPEAKNKEDPIMHVSYPVFIVMGRK